MSSIESLLKNALNALIEEPNSALRMRIAGHGYKMPGFEHRQVLARRYSNLDGLHHPSFEVWFFEGVIQTLACLAVDAGIKPEFWSVDTCNAAGCSKKATDLIGKYQVCAECSKAYGRFLETQKASRDSFWKQAPK